jgi:hypothetical protein
MSTHVNSVDYKLGQLDAAVKAIIQGNEEIKASISAMQTDIAEIKTKQTERDIRQKTERKMIAYAASAIGAAVMFVLNVIAKKMGIVS